MRKHLTTALLASMLLSAQAASAVQIGVSLEDSDFDDTAGFSGTFWNGSTGTSPSDGPLQLADNSGASDISYSTANTFGFLSGDRGQNTDVTAANGVKFHGSVVDGYIADNFDAAGRDGLGVLRFTSPTQYDFEFTVVSSYERGGQHETLINVGGTYDGAASRTFTGGDSELLTILSNGPLFDTATVLGQSVWNGSEYVIDLNVAYPFQSFNAGDNNQVASINAVYINATPTPLDEETPVVPEPVTATLSLGALAALAMRRRR